MSRSTIEKNNLDLFVIDLMSKGKTTREIAAAIQKEKNVKVSYVAVAAFLEKRKGEIKQVVDAAAQERALKTIPPLFDELNELLTYTKAFLYRPDLSDSDRIKAIRALRDVLESIGKFSGADSTGDDEQTILIKYEVVKS